jgi:N-acetyl sugar amidotransferase
MKSSPRLRFLADYLAATRNEIAVDEMLLRMAHVTPRQVGYLPRASHWLSRAVRAPLLTHLVWQAGRGLWLAGGALAYFTSELIKFAGLRMSVPSARGLPLTGGAVLGFSSRAGDVLDSERFPWLPSAWLTCPWAPQHALPRDAIELPLMSLVTGRDLRQAFGFAAAATYALARDPLRSRWVLQSYTAFRWYIVRCAVDRLGGNLVTTDHFDRWAVLVDRSIRARARPQHTSARLVVVQHGALGGLGRTSDKQGGLIIPTRLARVASLHAYNTEEENAFRRAVLTRACGGPALRVAYFSPTISLVGEAPSDRPRLLFVGHPLCEGFQQAVYAAIRQTLDIDAFYKPHPLAPMSAAIAAGDWKIVDNARDFPRVDLLISYPSTLVIEYEGAGVAASVHPLDSALDALPAFLEQTLDRIRSTARSRGSQKMSWQKATGDVNGTNKRNKMSHSNQICTRCIMDTSDPNIRFDANGLCDYCNNIDTVIKPNWHTDQRGEQELARIAADIRQAGEGKDFDCIIGLSGGLDSSFAAYIAKEKMGLRPLLFHVDAGWNTDQAVGNIEKLVDGLGLDLYTEVVNWNDVKRMQVAFMRAGIPDQDLVQDAAFFSGLYKFARKYKIKHIITGSNFSTECCREPEEWGGYLGIDKALFNDIWNKCGDGAPNDFPLVDILVYKLWYQKVLGMKMHYPLNHVPYVKKDAEDELGCRFGWQRFQHKHHESRFTRFYEDYWLPRRFGYEKRRAHFSSLIMTGQMTREQALDRISRPEMDEHFLTQEFEYVAHKLGLTVGELQQLFNLPKKTYRDYDNKRWLIGLGANALRLLGAEKRYFR